MNDTTLVLCKPGAARPGRRDRWPHRAQGPHDRRSSSGSSTPRPRLCGAPGKPFVDDLVTFITRSPLVAMVVEGPDAWKVMRTLMGVTNPREAAPGTIRGDLAIELTENLVHGSDGPESAAREIALFFPGLS
jgi:nucleoside-diphosphate kinase